jgi:hypothetical protein
MIAAFLSACVINPQDLAGLLDHASRFTWAVIVLILVRAVTPLSARTMWLTGADIRS